MKIKKFLILTICLCLVFISTGCGSAVDTSAQKAYKNETLVWWSVWDNRSDVIDLINDYRVIHPNVNIDYRKFTYDEYEKELVDALAEDRGPDIFSVHNTWMNRYKTKIKPIPEKISTPIKFEQGSVRKVEAYKFTQTKPITPPEVRKKFLDVVAQDVNMYDDVYNNDNKEKVWGLPRSVDTLVLYYNKNILNNAGVPEPPKTWGEFQEHVKKITQINKDTGEILLSGSSIGLAENVERSFDILSLLMMQNLTPMTTGGKASFNQYPEDIKGLEIPPGLGALNYYTQFASPLYEGYCWNDKMPNSLDAFASGQVAYFFGYSYHYPQLIAKAPKFTFAIAPVPQVGGQQTVNYANYWIDTVSRKTKVSDYAFDFLQFMTNEDNVVKYLDKAKKTTALRSTKLINEQLADERLAPSAEQLLTAKSWYRGYSSAAAEEIFAELIKQNLIGMDEPEAILKNAVSKINYTIVNKL